MASHTRTFELQEVAESQAEGHVRKLWGRLHDAMKAVSQWGHDLVDSWQLSREVRKVERDLATFTGKKPNPEPLPRDPVVLRELLRERRADVEKAWRENEARRTQNPPGGPSRGRFDGGMPRQ